MNLPLLALSPAVRGFLVPGLPHVLAFCFGTDVDLRRPYPSSFSAVYRPRVLGDPAGLDRSAFLASPDTSDGPRLLSWWVDRLNELYSHATDPTRFVTDHGYYDAAAQTAWMITLERLIGDAVSLLAEPQATDLDRVQISFDLLDKAESLLGMGAEGRARGSQHSCAVDSVFHESERLSVHYPRTLPTVFRTRWRGSSTSSTPRSGGTL